MLEHVPERDALELLLQWDVFEARGHLEQMVLLGPGTRFGTRLYTLDRIAFGSQEGDEFPRSAAYVQESS